MTLLILLFAIAVFHVNLTMNANIKQKIQTMFITIRLVHFTKMEKRNIGIKWVEHIEGLSISKQIQPRRYLPAQS